MGCFFLLGILINEKKYQEEKPKGVKHEDIMCAIKVYQQPKERGENREDTYFVKEMLSQIC